MRDDMQPERADQEQEVVAAPEDGASGIKASDIQRQLSDPRIAEFQEDFSLLIEGGFVAVKQLDEISATRMFLAAQVLSPSSVAPQIGLGYIALNKLDIKEASHIFEEVIRQDPANDLAKTFYGICLLLDKSRREEGEQLIKEVVSLTSDPTIKNLGDISLEWADKDLRKMKTLF